jgi:hypothetical protein
MNTFNIEVRVVSMPAEVTVGQKGTRKRSLRTETLDTKYPQKLEFEFLGERCDKVKGLHIGDIVTVSFEPRGREYQGRWFVSLFGWDIAGADNAPVAETPTASTAPNAAQPFYDAVDDEDIPF